MIVSHKYKFAYMPPPKTGCTSMAAWLIKCFDAKSWTPFKKSRHPHHDAHLHESMKYYFVFATVRNPYYHEISFWKYFHSHRISFEKFSGQRHGGSKTIYKFLNQHEGYNPPRKCVKFNLDMTIRLEHLTEDVKKLPFAFDRHFPHFRHLNKGSRFLPYLSENLLSNIKRRRKKDFKEFGYDMEFPEDLMRPKIMFQ